MNHDEFHDDDEPAVPFSPSIATDAEIAEAADENTGAAQPTELNLEEADLPQLVAAAQAGKMSPDLEARTTERLRMALLGGKPEIAEALDAIAKLPWPVSVNGLNAAWAEIKPYGKRLFVSGMKGPAFDGEIGRRIRLSITRGLVKVDEPQAAKWACAISAEMLGDDGSLATRDRQSFFNVLVGKGKPWLLRLPLEGLKESEIASLLNAAIGTIFLGGCPPFTQSTLLQWIFKLGKAGLLSEKAQLAIATSVRKWPGRLMRDFKTLPEGLPPLIAEAFSEKNVRRGDSEPADREKINKPNEEQPENGSDALEKSPKTARDEDADDDGQNQDDDDEDEEEDEDDDLPDRREPARERNEGRSKHPPYVSPGQANRPQGQSEPRQSSRGERSNPATFDPVATLRQLDTFIRQQSQALSQARTQLRQREDEGRGSGGKRAGRSRGRFGGDNVWPDTTQPEDNESLRRYIVQLEGINADLRSRLEDLAVDGERRAESLLNTDGTPKGEREQLVNFLALKLGKDHADFVKLSGEPEDEVFCEHYRIVAQNVFEILAAEGILPKPPEVVAAELG